MSVHDGKHPEIKWSSQEEWSCTHPYTVQASTVQHTVIKTSIESVFSGDLAPASKKLNTQTHIWVWLIHKLWVTHENFKATLIAAEAKRACVCVCVCMVNVDNNQTRAGKSSSLQYSH